MGGTEDKEWVSIGRVTAPHGIRGEVRVYPLTDVEDRFDRIERVFVAKGPGPGERRPLHVIRAKRKKALVILQFREITTVDEAERLRDALLQVPVSEVAPLPQGMYYVFQLVGLEVYTVDGAYVGTVADVLTENLPHDVYVVEREGKDPAFIPAVRRFVRTIDLESGRITIDPIPGLL